MLRKTVSMTCRGHGSGGGGVEVVEGGGWDEGRWETDIMDTAGLVRGKEACEDTIDRLMVTHRHTDI